MCQTCCKGILKLLVLLAVLWPAGAGAQLSGSVIPPSGENIMIEVDQGKLIHLDQAVASVFIVNPNVADVTVRSSRLIYLFGRRTGKTSLYALDAKNNIIVNTEVVVQHNVSGLEEALDSLLPSNDLQVISIHGGIILDGNVATAREAEDARRLATRFIGAGEEIINRLAVTGPNQVNLRVRVAEVSRRAIKDLGLNFDAAGSDFFFTTGTTFLENPTPLRSGGTFAIPATLFGGGALVGQQIGNVVLNALFDTLEEMGLSRILAEPNLTALSGETASFLAGGEFPIPTPGSDGATTIEFKKFGVSLSFTPTIISSNRINIRVRPEVSQLSQQGAVTSGGFNIPALTTRRTETTIELASGQSFAIAGLIEDRFSDTIQQMPWLGDLPILGALFRSESFRRDETELVIVVTPYIVNPVDADNIPLPTDPFMAPQANGRKELSKSTAQSKYIPVPGGSVVAGAPDTFNYILD